MDAVLHSIGRHLIIWVYILIALALVYGPPPKSLKGLGRFIERHFGDSVGFYILHLGIGLVILGGAFPWMAGVTSTGNSLILAGVGVLKLKTVPSGDNGTLPTGATITQTGPKP